VCEVIDCQRIASRVLLACCLRTEPMKRFGYSNTTKDEVGWDRLPAVLGVAFCGEGRNARRDQIAGIGATVEALFGLSFEPQLVRLREVASFFGGRPKWLLLFSGVRVKKVKVMTRSTVVIGGPRCGDLPFSASSFSTDILQLRGGLLEDCGCAKPFLFEWR
jgi:hypothetical protein